MNPLSIAVTFVLCSILLSFAKKWYFNDDDAANSSIKMEKVFQLSNNKPDKQNKYFKSLYEAYFKHQMLNAQKMSKFIYNRTNFNQSVLQWQLGKGEQTLMCGIDYLLVIKSGIRSLYCLENSCSDRMQWSTNIDVYKLPLLTKISSQSVEDKISLPKQCKLYKKYDIENNSEQPDSLYELVVVSRSQFTVFHIGGKDGIRVVSSIDRQFNYCAGTNVFDFGMGYIVYWSQLQPWVITVQSLQKLAHPLQIPIVKQAQLQQIDLQQILLKEHNSLLHITIVYCQHNITTNTKYIYVSNYILYNIESYRLLSQSMIDFGTVAQYGDTHTQGIVDCALFDQEAETADGRVWNMACLVQNFQTDTHKYVNLVDIFSEFKQDGNQSFKQFQAYREEEQDHEAMQSEEYYEQESDDDMGWLQQLLQQPEEKQKQYSSDPQYSTQSWKYRKITLTFKSLSPSRKHLLWGASPTPILHYKKQNKHYILIFAYDNRLQQLTREPQVPLVYLLSQLSPPQCLEAKKLRYIQHVPEQKLIVVLWSCAIQIYAYQYTVIQDMQLQGISVLSILPFVQLFATVFCILRTIWSNQ